MAKKTIIPDFTLALGADLREAAAKMREMSRPPAHHADSPTPEASSSFDEETTDMPSAGEELKNDEPAPKTAAAYTPLYVTDPAQNDALPSQLSVSIVKSSEKIVRFSDDADEAAPVFSGKPSEAPAPSPQETDDSVTNEETADSIVPPVVNGKEHIGEAALSSEKERATSAKRESPFSEAAPESVPLAQESMEASLPASPKQVTVPRLFSGPQEEERSEERDASAQCRTPAMNPKEAAPSETSFTPPLPPEERVSSPSKEQAAQTPPCPSQPLQTASAVPERSSLSQERNEASAIYAAPEKALAAATASGAETVTDCHRQLQTVTGCHASYVTPHDRDDCLSQSSTVIDSQLRSSHIIKKTMTVDDRHSLSEPSAKTDLPEPNRMERLPDVSPSFTAGAPAQAPVCGRTSAAAEFVSPAAAERRALPSQPEKTAASPLPQYVSPCVTMTVTDTNNIHELQGIKPSASTGGLSIASATLQEVPLGGARQTLLTALDTLRGPSPQVVVNLKRLAAAIGLSYGTVRNTISRLVREGIICTTQVRTGEAHGVCIEFLEDTSLQSLTVMGAHAFPQAAFSPMQPSPVTNGHQQSMTVNDNIMTHAMTADDISIWSVDARLMADLWPYAAQAGLSPAHLTQLRRAYQVQGWDAGNVPRCLRYLDWELAQGLAAGPEHVAGWLRVMQRQGHYPRPEGYADPEVLRLQQQAEEQRELAQARQDVADARAFLDATSRQG